MQIGTSAPSKVRFLVANSLRMLHLDRAVLKVRSVARQFGPYAKLRFGLRKWPEYAHSLGLVPGLICFLKCYHGGGSLGAAVRVPGPKRNSRLTLRPRTADVGVFEQIYIARQYQLDAPSEPNLIIDAGAHIGCATVLFAEKFPNATIFAIEPQASNFALLRQNVARYPNVTAINAALWGRPSVQSIINPKGDSWEFRTQVALSHNASCVIGITIDELLTWCGASKLDILKLDVEGAEKNIFGEDAS